MTRDFFPEHGGSIIVSCKKCDMYLTNRTELVSDRFQGSTGKAYLYSRVWNVSTGDRDVRDMLTGRHVVRDIFCKQCDEKLGWMYEFASEEGQRYKEMKVILEKALITESEGLVDPKLGNADTSSFRDSEGNPIPNIVSEPVETNQIIDPREWRRTRAKVPQASPETDPTPIPSPSNMLESRHSSYFERY